MRIIPIIFVAILVAAHFLRTGSIGLVIACALAPAILLIKKRWVLAVGQALTLAATLVWINTGSTLINVRRMFGEPWGRLALILGAVALTTAATLLIFRTGKMKTWYRAGEDSKTASTVAFFLTAGTLSFVQIKVPLTMLLLERFIPGGGWIEVLGFGVYAAWITEKMLDTAQAPKWRKRIWVLFSIVFFSQLALGLLGLDEFLLTGDLHIPVPALIAAGPVFRGEGFFMPILFAVTIGLVGPAWCSHLCYIGAWDFALSSNKRRPKSLPVWTRHARYIILVAVVGAAVLLRILGASIATAAYVSIGFGLLGVGVMFTWSRKVGAMVHCVVFCPIGLAANFLGKLSPFRIRLLPDCSECGKCTSKCRYDALNKIDIKRRRPSLTCTLCGDCLPSCKENQIEYRFGFLRGRKARQIFLVLAVSLHAVFMAVARI